MNPAPHDANSLDDALNRLLAGGQVNPTEVSNDPLIAAAARLNAAPRPSLSPAAAARIRAVVLAAQAVQPAASSNSVQRYFPRSAPLRLVLVAALATLLVAAVLFAARSSIQFLSTPFVPSSSTTATQTPLPSNTPTVTASATLALASATGVLPLASATVSELPAPTTVPFATTPAPSATPTTLPITAVSPPTSTPTATLVVPIPTTLVTPLSPTQTAQPALPVRIILEGPVRAIEGSTITIFDLAVLLSPEDPVLARIQIGVVVRVEGRIAAGSLVITAVSVTPIEPELPVNVPLARSNDNPNPSEGEVWRDNGNCNNPPPDWAPANGWRRRCEGASHPGNSGNNGHDDN